MNQIDKNEFKKIIKDPLNYANSLTVKKLEKTLTHLSQSYYTTGENLVSDEIYDILRSILEDRDPVNPYLKQIGAPGTRNIVKLPYPMASLDKMKTDTNALDQWIKKFHGPYVISDKLDGVSCLLVCKNNKFDLYTREGIDISHLMSAVNIRTKDIHIPNDTAVRGELIIRKKDFEQNVKGKKNPRSAVSGLVTAKKYARDVAENTNFIAYTLLNPLHDKKTQLDLLKKWGFNIVTYLSRKNIDNNFLNDYLLTRREKGIYEIDGLVVTDSSQSYKETKDNPDHSKAYKTIINDQIAETIVLDVTWDVSMDGFLNPVVIMSTVTISGTTVQRSTGYNAKYINDNVIGPGAVIKIIRSGDVIPKIIQIIKESANGKPKLPDEAFVWSETNVDIIVKDLNGKYKNEIISKRINHFCEILNIKYINIDTVRKLVDNGYDTIIKIMRANINDLIKIDGIGEKNTMKIKENIITSIKSASLHEVMAATHIFGRGLGTKKIKLITKYYPDILDTNEIKDEIVNMLIKIKGLEEKTAVKFACGLPEFKKFIADLNKIIDLSHLKKKQKTTNGIFKDKNIAFTGFRDKSLENYVSDNGGFVTTSVSKNTNMVVCSDPSGTSAKLKEAKKLKLIIMTKQEFIKKFNIII